MRRDYPILRDILDQSLASISQEEMDKIISSRLSFSLQSSRRADLLRRRIALLLGVAAAITTIFYLWNQVIRKEIRARRAAEAELRDINRSLEVFSQAVSHDLKRPLRAIRGFSELLREKCGGALDPTDHEYFDRIFAATTRMDHLISGVRPTATRPTPNSESRPSP